MRKKRLLVAATIHLVIFSFHLPAQVHGQILNSTLSRIGIHFQQQARTQTIAASQNSEKNKAKESQNEDSLTPVSPTPSPTATFTPSPTPTFQPTPTAVQIVQAGTITPTASPSATLNKKRPTPTPVPKVFSQNDAAKPVAFALIILLAALGIVFFRNYSMKIDHAIRTFFARITRKG